MRISAIAALCLCLGVSGWAATAKRKTSGTKSSTSKSAKPKPAADAKAKEADKPPSSRDAAAPSSSTPRQEKDDSLDVTITGEAKDQVPLVKEPPPLYIPFGEIIAFSQEGETEQILMTPLQHMTKAQRKSLMTLRSRQATKALPVDIPEPPFFQVEVPAGLGSAPWSLEIVDQDNQVVKKLQGEALPARFVEWDGFDGGRPLVRVGPASSPILSVKGARGGNQRYFGDPVRLDVLQYQSGGVLRVEFGNDRLYERGSSDLSPSMNLFLETLLDRIRQNGASGYKVVIYQEARSRAPLDRRLDRWRKYLEENLTAAPGSLNVSGSEPVGRGEITEVTVPLSR